jgi:glycosyltransferase involved in cell wall biosynthesis
LVIVGDGKARQKLQVLAGESARKNIIFTGYSSSPRDWLETFDVFVSAARSEPFGLVFLEAMHAGLPIIASASEGARHLAASIQTPLFPIDDVDALSRTFREMSAQLPPRRHYDMQGFDPVARTTEILAFYQRCLDNKSN